ncbi:hypothetical protein BP5796_03788 [Coleophoma crateriformis]|uniref:Peptidase A1 domain-containing protein n=1 Tax=Coleophoma crateriformis TaxID=565419 RepID=A0A3D8SGP9_9HELO|nr:hypothetical protein BP5796_03788 [Coleophoma crateriformis]
MMRPSVFGAFLYSLLYLCSFSSALVSWPVYRNIPSTGVSLSRRANYGEVLTNNVSLSAYYASVEVGTPAQTLQLVLSTGSSDVWVISIAAETCTANPNTCVTPFNSTFSQTVSTVASGGFNITYVDGTYANGDYITDEFAIGQVGQARMVLQMGLATNITQTMAKEGGVMGIGYPGNEVANVPYLNFMDQMVNNKLTNTKLYSLWLNDLDSSTGSILFGGIDTDKYYGTLYSMPIHPDSNGNYTNFWVGLTAVSLKTGTGSTIDLTNTSFSATVVLESSTTVIYLPGDVVNTLYQSFNVTVYEGTAYCDCKYANSTAAINFVFESNSAVDVPYSEIINKLFVPNPVPSNVTFSDVCSFAILDGDDQGIYLLGDSFLRSAYVVYDLTNNRVGIAQAVINTTSSNVVEVAAGAASIPQSTGLPLPTSSGATTTISSLPTGPTSTNTGSPKSSNNNAVAIGVGVAVPVAVILAAIVGFFCWRRRKQASKTAAGQNDAPEMVSAPPAGVAASYVKQQPDGLQSPGGTGRTRWSNVSELPSADPTPANSPRAPDAAFDRSYGMSELPAYETRISDPPTSTSPPPQNLSAEARPLSNLTEGPLEDMPTHR